ncbi:MAG TPA: hypothetical protein VNK41_11380, partial [Vicinamibacterales bacterium]|nr:hypothetical protein [Vicinamibacterales bacterium]
MQIQVSGDDTISRQARTYAEYRVFGVLAHLAGAADAIQARVALRYRPGRPKSGSVTCTVAVILAGVPALRIRTRAPHAYAAINRAVERLRSATLAPSTPPRT